MNEQTQPCCTISGKTVWELPYGMDEAHPDCVALKLNIAAKIAELNTNGITDFICNCEYGVSLWTAEIISAMRSNLAIRLNIIMPFEGQADRYSKKVRERFFNLHANADSVIMLATHWHEACYRKADIDMMDHSTILLTDNTDSFIAKYAVKNGKRIEICGKLPLGTF